MPKLKSVPKSINKSIADAAPAAAVSEFTDALQESMDTLAAPGNSHNAQGEWVDKEREAIERATVSQALWEKQIARLIDAQESLKQKTDELVSHQYAALKTENEIAQVRKILEEARVELKEKLGRITPEQAIRLRVEIDERAFKEQAGLKKLHGDINAQHVKPAVMESIRNETTETEANTQRGEDNKNLLDAIMRGMAPPGQIQENRDYEQQDKMRNETGWQAGDDAGSLVNKAKTVANNVFGQAPNGAQHAEIHEILNGIIGFQENQLAEVRRQASDLAEIKSRLENLDSQFALNRNGP